MGRIGRFAFGILTAAVVTTITLVVIRHIRPLSNLAGLQPAGRAVGPNITLLENEAA